MKINSLGFLTNLMFAKFSGSVEDRGSYTLIKTPSNPSYHWGNYIIFDHPPRSGDLKKWTAIFDREFNYYSEPHHYVFAWESGEGECKEFLDANFEKESAVVLTTSVLNPPRFLNSKIELRKISLEKDWSDVLELQVLCAEPKYINDYYRDFKVEQMKQYREMSEAGLGNWFGAYLNDRLIGDLGIFRDSGVGRYQSVGTHPEFRRQGVCGTLVYQAGLIAMKEFSLKYLVMEADPDYHAARVYESVGFQRSEVNHALSWWKLRPSRD